MVAAGGSVRPIWEIPPPQWLLDYIGDSRIFPIISRKCMSERETVFDTWRAYFVSVNRSQS